MQSPAGVTEYFFYSRSFAWPITMQNIHHTCIQSLSTILLIQPIKILHWVCFDYDPSIIWVDSHCSTTMSPNKDNFKDLKLRHFGECIGIDTQLVIAGKGTFIMKIEVDNNRIHKTKIPNSLYVQHLQMVPLSPQHWAQQAKDIVPDPIGTCLI